MTFLGPYPLNSIITGDARELSKAIPDESVDLIFTDPPYPKEYLHLYGWLAETAQRILNPGGLCLAMAGQSYLPEIYRMMSEYMVYHWTFSLDTPGESCVIWNRRVNSKWKPIISYVKGDYTNHMFGTDRVPSALNDKRFHRWGQSITSAVWFFERLNPLVVFEPFAGGGATLEACEIMCINYLAFEINPDTAEDARRRVRDTQPPLPIVYAEQAVLI